MMPARLLGFVDQSYRALLQAYPAAFRERFSAEMAQVFRSLCRQTYTDSGSIAVLALWLSATWDGMLVALHQWYLYLRKQRTGNMNTDLSERRDGIQPLTPLQTAAAVLPFILFGISSLVSKSDIFQIHPPIPPLWVVLVTQPYLIFNWIVIIGLAVGILAGFPRWAHAYLGWSLVLALLWTGMSVAGYRLGNYFWLTILGAFLFNILVRRSWQPLRQILAGLWQDWTLPSLIIYIFYSFVFMLYDSNHHPYLMAFIVMTTLAVSLGALVYFRSVSPLRRVLALAGGLLLAAVLSGISEATWDFGAYYGLPESTQQFNLMTLVISAVISLIMLGNGLLARWRSSRALRSKGS